MYSESHQLSIQIEKTRFSFIAEAGLVLRIAVRKNQPPRDSMVWK